MGKKYSEAETSAEPKTTEATEVKYTVAELSKAAEKVFGTTPDVVSAALHTHGLDMASVSEARSIVTRFANKEVKS